MEKSQDFYNLTIWQIGNASSHWRTATRDNDVIKPNHWRFPPCTVHCRRGNTVSLARKDNRLL
jgi:hypothetical protein